MLVYSMLIHCLPNVIINGSLLPALLFNTIISEHCSCKGTDEITPVICVPPYCAILMNMIPVLLHCTVRVALFRTSPVHCIII